MGNKGITSFFRKRNGEGVAGSKACRAAMVRLHRWAFTGFGTQGVMVGNSTHPHVRLTHKPTGIVVVVQEDRSIGRSLAKCRALAMSILRSMVMHPDPAKPWHYSHIVRKYDLTPGMERIVDMRTAKEVAGDGVNSVMDRGDLEFLQ